MKYLYKKIHCLRAMDWSLYPISDVHKDDDWAGRYDYNKEAWEKWRDKIARNPFGLYVGLGDWLNAFRFSNARKIKRELDGERDARSLDKSYMKLCDEFIRTEMEHFSTDRFLGLVESNHTYIFQNGSTMTQYICQQMKIPYLGTEGYVRLSFCTGKNGLAEHSFTVDMVVRHSIQGCGNAKSALLKMQRTLPLVYPDARIFIAGHIHESATCHDAPLRPISSRGFNTILAEESRHYVMAGSWQKSRHVEDAKIPIALDPDESGSTLYAERMGFVSNGNGPVNIRISIGRRRDRELGKKTGDTDGYRSRRYADISVEL